MSGVVKIKLSIPDQRPDPEPCQLSVGDPRVAGTGACLLRYLTDQTFLNFIDLFRKLRKYRDGSPSGSEYSLLREVLDPILVRSFALRLRSQ